jgi:hypothetical protein
MASTEIIERMKETANKKTSDKQSEKGEKVAIYESSDDDSE